MEAMEISDSTRIEKSIRFGTETNRQYAEIDMFLRGFTLEKRNRLEKAADGFIELAKEILKDS